MSDEDTIGGDDRHDFTAAEYVLGVLGAEDRRAAEFRMASEPKFAAEVAFWETRLGGLAEAVPAVVPPAKVWAGIEDRLSASLEPPRERAGFWNSLAFWRPFAIASAGLAVASMAGLVYLAQTPSLGPPLLATLDEQSGQPGFLAAANPADGTVTVVPAALLTGALQQSYELWVIPPGGKPHSLGLVDPKRPVKVVVPPELLPHVSADSTLAISHRARRRLADRPADRPGHRQRQARELVVTAVGVAFSLPLMGGWRARLCRDRRVGWCACPPPGARSARRPPHEGEVWALCWQTITSSSQRVQPRPCIPVHRPSVAPGVTPILGASTSYRSRPMKLSTFVLSGLAAAALAVSAIALPTIAKEMTVEVGGAPMYPSKNIIQNAVNSKDHTTLVAAVKAAGLVDTLSGKGPFTVFAPTNDAFAKLPAGTVDTLLKPENKDALVGVLTYHVVPGRYTAKDIMAMVEKDGGKTTLKTVEGEQLTFQSKDGALWVWDSKGNAAKITIKNVMQSNGVIHVIDAVLMHG